MRTPGRGVASTRFEPPQTHDQLLARLANALHANLARGFLEGEERIRQIAEALTDVVVLGDEACGKVFFVNAAYERVWGRPRSELYADPLAFFEGVHPEDRERVRSTLGAPGGLGYDLEFRVQQPDGSERWVWTRGFPVAVDGGINRVASIIEDITERKQIVQSHERLIRGFTHDVKNPLGAADGYLALLEEGIYGTMSDEQLLSVRHARRSIRSALSLVAGLLEIERAEAGTLDLEQTSLDLAVVAAEAVDEFRAAAEAKRIGMASLSRRSDDALVVVSDAARVRQVLANLMSNAVKYTQEGGRIAVVARVAPAEESPGGGRWATVAVADNGPGIPPEKHPLVFREFSRFDPGAASGSGIGLAISRRLARALGGDITFSSSPGIGSTFTLWLPISA